MKFGYTILYVDNVVTTVSFYESALGLTRLFVHESNEYAEMDTGSTRLAFASKNMASMNGFEFSDLPKSSAASPVELAFVTPDVDAAFKTAVSKGAKEIKSPVQKPWGQLVGYVRDCNGFLIEICSPMS